MLTDHSNRYADAEGGVGNPQNQKDRCPIQGEKNENMAVEDELDTCPEEPYRPHDDEQRLPAA